jgi:NAD(P)-dependent dehydrogenase (short-subunit alcohol dehydrogenase family)
MKIAGATVLLTGANGGISRLFVRELLARGAQKIYLGVRDPATLRRLFAPSAKLVPLALDLTQPAQIVAAARAAADITMLINNAGAARFSGALAAQDLKAAREEMEVNYFGLLALTQALRNSAGLQARMSALVHPLG